MRTHLEYVRPAARDNEFVDAPEAIGLHMLLTEALESWDDLDDEQGWYPAEAVATELRAAFVAATAERRTDSGERKSPTLNVLSDPLRRFAKAAQQEGRPERARKLAERELAQGRVEEARPPRTATAMARAA